MHFHWPDRLLTQVTCFSAMIGRSKVRIAFSSILFTPFSLSVFFFFSCTLLFCPLSLLWFVFPFLAFCFYFFLYCLHRKGDRYEIVKVGQKITFLTSIMLRSYRGRISRYCYISYNSNVSLFSIFLAIKGVFVLHGPIFILIFFR